MQYTANQSAIVNHLHGVCMWFEFWCFISWILFVSVLLISFIHLFIEIKKILAYGYFACKISTHKHMHAPQNYLLFIYLCPFLHLVPRFLYLCAPFTNWITLFNASHKIFAISLSRCISKSRFVDMVYHRMICNWNQVSNAWYFTRMDSFFTSAGQTYVSFMMGKKCFLRSQLLIKLQIHFFLVGVALLSVSLYEFRFFFLSSLFLCFCQVNSF